MHRGGQHPKGDISLHEHALKGCFRLGLGRDLEPVPESSSAIAWLDWVRGAYIHFIGIDTHNRTGRKPGPTPQQPGRKARTCSFDEPSRCFSLTLCSCNLPDPTHLN